MAAGGGTGPWHVAAGLIWMTGERRVFRGHFPNSALRDCEQGGLRCAGSG